jgi:hypothetical protein
VSFTVAVESPAQIQGSTSPDGEPTSSMVGPQQRRYGLQQLSTTLHNRPFPSAPSTRVHCSTKFKTPATAPTARGHDRHRNAIVMVEIHANRHGVEALNRIFDAYTNTITT